MKYRYIYPVIAFFLFSTLLFSQDGRLEVEGPIIVGNDQSITPINGSIRFTGQDFEGWNGTEWVSFTEQAGPSNILYQDELYSTIKIGSQTWFAENLRAPNYNDGTPIGLVNLDAYWAMPDFVGYCNYNKDSKNLNPYGYLYNFEAVKSDNPKNACPIGWHVPSDADWVTLIQTVGNVDTAGNSLKQTSDKYWEESTVDVTNNTFFTAMPGGLRLEDGSFSNLNTLGVFWTSETNPNSDEARAYGMQHSSSSIVPLGLHSSTGASIRCIKD